MIAPVYKRRNHAMRKSIDRSRKVKILCAVLALSCYLLSVLWTANAYQKSSGAAKQQGGATTPCPPVSPGGAFANNNGLIPPGYNGPHFVLSRNYPKVAPPKPDPVWNRYLNGQQFPNPATVEPYMMALRDYAFKALVPVDFRPENIKMGPTGEGGWYGSPWLGRAYATCQMGDRMAVPWPGQDYIRGTYFGTPLMAGTLPGQTCDYNNYETVFYNDVAGHWLGRVWRGGQLRPTDFQFPEGSVIVKLVFTTAPNTGVLENSPQWQIYVTPPCQTTPCVPSAQQPCPCNPVPCPARPQMTAVTLIQMDIVLKDTAHAPQTGWMFTTYVYNPNFNPTGSNSPYGGFDHMMPLGLMWGNDPGIMPGNPLKETVINGNPNMPSWFTTNLGWGGRLSGPIDGAKGTGSCLGCHSSAEYTLNPKQPLEAFSRMMPPEGTPDDKKGPWFRNLRGDEPWSGKRKGWKALDYSFVMLGAVTHYYASKGRKVAANVFNERARPDVNGVATHGISSASALIKNRDK
jgi:hypothetical protein